MGLFSSKSKSQTEVDPFRRDQMVDWTNRFFELSQQPRTLYPEQMYADLTPEELEALQMRMDIAQQAGEGILGPSMAAWGSTLQAPDVASNPYVQAMLEQQRAGAVQTLGEDILPMLRSRAIGSGQLGSSRQGIAEGQAVGRTMDALADAAARTQLGAYGQGLQQQQYGLSAAPGMLSLQQAPAGIMQEVGQQYRAEEQAAIDEARMRHDYAQNEPWTRLERFAGTYGPMTQPYSTTTNTQQTSPSGLQIAGQIGGAALLGGMGAGALGYGPMASQFTGGGNTGLFSGSTFGPKLAPSIGSGLALGTLNQNMAAPGGFMSMPAYGGLGMGMSQRPVGLAGVRW